MTIILQFAVWSSCPIEDESHCVHIPSRSCAEKIERAGEARVGPSPLRDQLLRRARAPRLRVSSHHKEACRIQAGRDVLRENAVVRLATQAGQLDFHVQINENKAGIGFSAPSDER
ncbi:hypothetical protein [Bradyrhizobium zhanjiangense]|uniref:hypothetical protein n=1 Tax=Bradyrhizobium zhanjiangense TaxID=1325107 RepID=UPI001009FC0B|nr:hypothetical protein [Bradyrhizobium zhanjiangense]